MVEVTHEEFSRRFQAACDGNPNVPEKNKGRLVWFREQFANRFGVSVTEESVRRWEAGITRPHPHQKMVQLAEILRVDVAWLATGQSNGATKKQALAKSELASGSINLIAGLMKMSGNHPAFPAEDDDFARENNIDLYCVVRGIQKLYHIAVAETKGDGRHGFTVPVNTGKAILIGVIARSGLNYRLVSINRQSVDEKGARKGDSITFDLSDVEHEDLEAF